MLPQEFFYTEQPKEKSVSEQEFEEFIKNYQRKLEEHVSGICDPPAVSYNDFELANRWPYSIVARTFLYSDDENDKFWYAPKNERKFFIVENYEELFKSKTGNKAKGGE